MTRKVERETFEKSKKNIKIFRVLKERNSGINCREETESEKSKICRETSIRMLRSNWS